MLKEVFHLVHRCNIPYAEAWDMPLELRRWWSSQVAKDNEKKPADDAQPVPLPWNRKT